MTPLATIRAELERPPDAYGAHKVREYAREMLAVLEQLERTYDTKFGEGKECQLNSSGFAHHGVSVLPAP